MSAKQSGMDSRLGMKMNSEMMDREKDPGRQKEGTMFSGQEKIRQELTIIGQRLNGMQRSSMSEDM